MRVLITAGSGVIAHGAAPALLGAGHWVGVLSSDPERDAIRLPRGVEIVPGNVGDPSTVRGSAAGVDAVLHVAEVVEEAPPEATFQRVNVDGTRAVLDEGERAGSPRLLFFSTLAADRGDSDYHRSKREAEALVRAYAGEWLVLRTGLVYGPEDDV